MKSLSTLLQIIALLWLSTGWSVAGFVLNPYRFSLPPAPPPDSDPDFDSVVLLAHMNGANGGTTFGDYSSYSRTLTRYGNAQTSTAQGKFNGSSGLFDGSGDYLSTPTATSLSLGSHGTVEFFVRFGSVAGSQVIVSNYQDVPSNSVIGYSVRLYAGVIRASFTGDGFDITGTTTVSTNTWYHVAISGVSGSWKLFINGTQEGSTFTGTTNLSSNKATTVGGLLYLGSMLDYFNGHLAELRITKGVSRYTTNFTPPTAAFPDS